jgi:hypothetical protein
MCYARDAMVFFVCVFYMFIQFFFCSFFPFAKPIFISLWPRTRQPVMTPVLTNDIFISFFFKLPSALFLSAFYLSLSLLFMLVANF